MFGQRNKKDNKLEDINDFLSNFRKKKPSKLEMTLKGVRIFIATLVFLLVVCLVLASFAFFKFKNVYDNAILGKASLEYSLSNARRGDFGEMVEAAIRAETYFSDILEELKRGTDNFLFRSNGFTREQIEDIEYLVKSAVVVSRSMSQAGEIAQEIDNVLAGRLGENFSQFSQAEKRRLLKTIYEAGPELNGIKANLELALLNLEQVQAGVIFLPVKGKINEVKEQLRTGVSSLSKLVVASQLVPEIAGYPRNSTFLILFQNNSELRPTGGFLGTYGILEMDSGDISRFDTHDVYHMDMPMEAGKLLAIEPPAPIKKYLNNNWYLRDANWSPDWPTSAQQIDWFYHEEDKRLPEENQINDFNGSFSGIIAVTPELVESLLGMIGPVGIGSEIFDKNNFVELLEYKVEQDFLNQNISSWERKEIISQILEEIKLKMFDLHYSQWPELARILNENIEQKNILAYFHDENLERLALELGVAGEIKNTQGDYLMVVDSNMAAMKTDIVIERTMKYSVEEKGDKLIASLDLKYTNNGVYDWRTGDYHTYTRVYVPRGSKLIKAEGITKGGIESGEELGKTYFAGFLSVRVGKTGTLHFEYELPQIIGDDLKIGNYSLYIQKQPGKKVKNITVDLKAQSDVISYNPKESADIVESNRILWNTDIDTDKSFEINF